MAANWKSIGQLEQELAARKKVLAGLKAERAKLAAQLAKVDGQIAAIAGKGKPKNGRRRRKVAKRGPGRPKKAVAAKRGPGRPKKKAVAAKRGPGRPKKKAVVAKRGRRRATGKPLAAYIREVLAGKPKGMRAKEISAAVAKAGYKSFSKDFYGIVATALRDKKNFHKLARGVYALP